MRSLVLALLVTACGSDPQDVPMDPGEGSGSDGSGSGSADPGIPLVRCSGKPDAGAATGFDHITSSTTAAIADARHRGLDLVATADADPQVIEGDASYGTLDKAVEDEVVDLFACRQEQWVKIGSARTDSEGHFSISLKGTDRLPVGDRDMFASVAGDRTGAYFIAVVAPVGTALAITDVDGTLTSSENAFLSNVTLGDAIDIQPDAPAAFTAIAGKHYLPVYLTARPRMYTTETRAWLQDKQMPRGPLHLAPGIMLPGSSTTQFKLDAMKSWGGFDLAFGNGNRATDIDAYTQAGLPADRIFIKLPEYQSEVQAQLDAHAAIGYAAYADLNNQYIAKLPTM